MCYEFSNGFFNLLHMRKLFHFCLVVLVFCGCSKDEEWIRVSNDDLQEISYYGGEFTIEVSSSQMWSAQSDKAWCVVRDPFNRSSPKTNL